MRIHSLLVIATGLALSLPLAAAHRHGRDCGHFFDSRQGGWFSVQIGTPFGYGIVNRGFDRDRRFNRYGDRYDGRNYQDSRRFKQNKKFFKKLRKQGLRGHGRFYHQRHHVHGPHCWY
jgi:hypothetical protein